MRKLRFHPSDIHKSDELYNYLVRPELYVIQIDKISREVIHKYVENIQHITSEYSD